MNPPTAFWDTSALAPLCLVAQATAAHRRHARETAMVVWWATAVVARGAICRFYRDESPEDAGRAGALARLNALRRSWREILPTEKVRELAGRQLDRYELRAADAFQLAAALAWCSEMPGGEVS